MNFLFYQCLLIGGRAQWQSKNPVYILKKMGGLFFIQCSCFTFFKLEHAPWRHLLQIWKMSEKKQGSHIHRLDYLYRLILHLCTSPLKIPFFCPSMQMGAAKHCQNICFACIWKEEYSFLNLLLISWYSQNKLK